MNKVKDEFKSMNSQQLQEKVAELKRELFSLKLNSLTTHIKDYSQFKKLRKNISRAMTYLMQKENEV